MDKKLICSLLFHSCHYYYHLSCPNNINLNSDITTLILIAGHATKQAKLTNNTPTIGLGRNLDLTALLLALSLLIPHAHDANLLGIGQNIVLPLLLLLILNTSIHALGPMFCGPLHLLF